MPLRKFISLSGLVLALVAMTPAAAAMGAAEGTDRPLQGPTTAAATSLTTTVLVPSTGATLSGTSAVLDASASASAGVDQVNFLINNDYIARATPTIWGWIALWDTTSVPNGSYTLQSQVTDVDAQNAYSPGIAITVNNPTVAIVVPANMSNVSGTSVVLDAIASPGATSVVFHISNPGLIPVIPDTVIATATPTIWGWIAVVDSTRVPNGAGVYDMAYFLWAVASYPSGVSVTSEQPFFVGVINAPPSTTVGVPSNGATVTGGQWLDASASPGVTNVIYELNGGTLVNDVIATGTPTYVGWLAGFDSTTVPNGSYTLTSVASYAGGLTGTSPGVSITISN